MSAAVAPPAGFDPEKADNFEDIEKQFAVKAVQHMTVYWSLLKGIRGSAIRLTRLDDEIYEHLKTAFPEFNPKDRINEDEMKSKNGKERWRNFMMAYEKKVEDYNFGTLMRLSPTTNCKGQDDVIFVPRMQFYAIEIARNREGLNDWIYEKFEKKRATKKAANASS